MTKGLADLTDSLVGAVTSPPANLTKIQDTIGNIATSLSNAAPGIGNFTDGLITLADKISQKFPALTDWFNNAGKSFSDWIGKLSADGSLDTAFAGLGSVLKTIADTSAGC